MPKKAEKLDKAQLVEDGLEPKKNTGQPGRPKRRNTGVRLNGHLSKPASAEVEWMMNEFGTNKYDIISTAMVFYAKAMRGEQLFVSRRGAPKSMNSAVGRSQNALKAIWCEEVGGTTEGNTCHFDKYEVSFSGTTERMKRSLSLTDMPDTKEEFMAYVLGGYKTLKEAQEASEKRTQKKEDEE